ncbi:MAG: ketoacyl-ACP synthase III [Deltaproteobacteria bacterium]|nr:ketoacyl-ACP synthase III [Deltaproteobacteria bacterium]
MQFKSRFSILGTGCAVPENKVTNFDLEKHFETSDEWIRRRTGIHERRITKEKSEFTNSILITQAANKALQMADVPAESLDLIIVGTVTGDAVIPATAVLVQNNLGAHNALSFDITAACTGFILGLEIAGHYLANSSFKRALVVGSEVLSRYLTFKKRETDVLFADGSGAVVLEKTRSEQGLLASYTATDASFWNSIVIPGIDSPLQRTVHLDGKTVFKQAVHYISSSCEKTLVVCDFPIEKVDHFIFHQANVRINQAIAEKLNIPENKIHMNIHKYGNTSAASIPILLDEVYREGKIKRGDYIVMGALGSGLAYGSALLRW